MTCDSIRYWRREIGLDLIGRKEPFYFGGHGNSGILAEILPCRCA